MTDPRIVSLVNNFFSKYVVFEYRALETEAKAELARAIEGLLPPPHPIDIRKAGNATLAEAIAWMSQVAPHNYCEAVRALQAERDAGKERLRKAKDILRHYADTFCEFEEECCGKLDDDHCSGCRARAFLAKEEK